RAMGQPTKAEAAYIPYSPVMQGEALISWLCFCDAGYRAPSGSGAVQQTLTPLEGMLGGGLASAGTRGAGALRAAVSGPPLRDRFLGGHLIEKHVGRDAA